MRKSIYYLIANVLSTLAAAIFIGCVNNPYPFFGFDLVVDGLSKDCWEPMKILLPVLVLSIIVVVQDVISYYNHNKDSKAVPFTKTKDIIMGVITIVSILFTWIAAILQFDEYAVGNVVSAPWYFIGAYLIGIVLIFVAPLISRKNQGIGASLVFASILLMISGFLYEVLPYWYTLLAALGTTVLAFAVLSFLSLRNKNN